MELKVDDEFFQEDEESKTRGGWKVCALQDSVIPSRSVARVPVVAPSDCNQIEVILEGNRFLKMEKEIFLASSLITLQGIRGEAWITKSRKDPIIIPRGMSLEKTQPVDETHLNVILETVASETAGSANYETMEIDSQINVSPALTPAQRSELLEAIKKFPGAFDLGKQKSAANLGVKHRIQTEDNRPISQMA
ncbi:hypothetical protein JTE90_010108 [Oedothorax gibbosus]|uniref:Uncharacterized protein n=1 Tax=Oedothorax gibbosus TaxID=931172 RepID=A0AAV6TKC9_9ARAC|nr:hypothetical protein JTE90_010108 [Oedothorax gibbosus]